MSSSSTQFGSRLNIASVAGTVPPLQETGLTQAELNAEADGPGNPAANTPPLSQMDWQLMAQQQAELLKMLKEKADKADLLIQKQAQELAASKFYVHQIGGRDGSDPLTDDSVRLVTLPDGKQALDIRVYLNPTPVKGSVTRSKFPETELVDGKRVTKLVNGKPVYREFINWDLGRTIIRECPIVVKTTQGDVTITGMAIANVGRWTQAEVETRADTQASNLTKSHLSDADVSEDGQKLAGSDGDSADQKS